MSNNILFNNSILLCEQDDIFCVIDNCEYIKVDKSNIKQIYDIYEEYKNKSNILIDSRCVEIIIYCYFKYLHNILIYNVINNHIDNVFTWSRYLLKINGNLFNIIYLKKILFLYLFSILYLKNIQNKPSFSSNIATNIITDSYSSDIITLDFLISFINKSYSTNKFNEKLYKELYNIISLKNISNVKPLPKTVTINEIQNCLANLLANEIVLNI